VLDAGLTDVPELRLPKLRELHLRTNALTAVPETVRLMPELRLLDLRANRLTSIPDWIVELPRLEKLDLRWNEVYDPPGELLARGCVVLTE
jgi:Leucine-rich repeat (LRR) protein